MLDLVSPGEHRECYSGIFRYSIALFRDELMLMCLVSEFHRNVRREGVSTDVVFCPLTSTTTSPRVCVVATNIEQFLKTLP